MATTITLDNNQPSQCYFLDLPAKAAHAYSPDRIGFEELLGAMIGSRGTKLLGTE